MSKRRSGGYRGKHPANYLRLYGGDFTSGKPFPFSFPAEHDEPVEPRPTCSRLTRVAVLVLLLLAIALTIVAVA